MIAVVGSDAPSLHRTIFELMVLAHRSNEKSMEDSLETVPAGCALRGLALFAARIFIVLF